TSGHGLLHVGQVGEVALHLLDAEFGQPRVGRAGEGADGGAAGEQFADDRPAGEPAAAGDEGFHRRASAGTGRRGQSLSVSAQGASFSRKIFELCRTSTGNVPWYGRNVSMCRVCSNRAASACRSWMTSSSSRGPSNSKQTTGYVAPSLV